MDYLGQGTAENTVFRWLGHRKLKVLHSSPRRLQEASVVNMPIEEIREHAKTFVKRQECLPTGVKKLPEYPEGSADEVYIEGKQLRCPKCGVGTRWAMHGLTTHMKTS